MPTYKLIQSGEPEFVETLMHEDAAGTPTISLIGIDVAFLSSGGRLVTMILSHEKQEKLRLAGMSIENNQLATE